MSPELDYRQIGCPYCGEYFETGIDSSAGSQSYIEDCQVCCRPIEFRLEVDGNGEITVSTRRDDE